LNIQLYDNQIDNIYVELYDMMGKLRMIAQNISEDCVQLDISSLAQGIYLLKVSDEQTIHTYKIVKQ
jgi:hypothetical protein